jgi:hypothetical protein
MLVSVRHRTRDDGDVVSVPVELLDLVVHGVAEEQIAIQVEA